MMKKYSIVVGILGVVAIAIGSASIAGVSKAVRATELTTKVWSDLEHGVVQELLVEFRQGDRLPVSLQAEGDFIETTEVNPSYVVVKRPFWVKMEQDQVLVSLDGTIFKPLKQVIGGDFTVGASSGQSGSGAVNAINLLFKAYLK